MDPTQPQQQPPVQPQQPFTPAPVPTPPQVNSVQTPPPLPPKTSKVKTTGAVLTIVYGFFSILIGLATLGASALIGLLILAVAITWIVFAIKALSSSGEKAAKALRTIAIIAMVYAGIQLIASIGLPGFSMSAAVFPIVFAITIAILSNKFSVSLRS
jgi:hypothetical protein